MRVNDLTPCVENVAFHKESWVNSRKQVKRHVRNQWMHGQASRAVDGQTGQTGDLSSVAAGCTVLDNFYVDKPVWMVDLGKKTTITGIIIYTWTAAEQAGGKSTGQREAMHNLDRLVVYADNGAGKEPFDRPDNNCGSISRLNDALYRPRLHVQCRRPMKAQFVYIEAWGVAKRHSRKFGAVLCEVMVYS